MLSWQPNIDDTLPGSSRGRSIPVIPTYRIETYDIWAAGIPVHTGVQSYDHAMILASYYSGSLPAYILYVFYSGVYGKGPNRPRPLAVFRAGERLPFPIRLTPPSSIEVRPEFPKLVYVLRQAR